MSAVNIFHTPEGVMIFTDAARYDADGVLTGLGVKARATANGRLVVMGRGNALFSEVVFRGLDTLAMTIDDFERCGEDALETLFAKAEAAFIKAVGRARNDLWVAGWSHRDEKAKVLQWSNCAPAGVERFSLAADGVLAPEPSPEAWARVRAATAGMNPRAPDFGRIGMEMMKAQRLDTGSLPGCEGQYLVGGHILRTDVTRKGITQRVVHEWPEDRIGERIRPVPTFDPATAPNVTSFAGMSRQERRRAEKLAKKGRAA